MAGHVRAAGLWQSAKVLRSCCSSGTGQIRTTWSVLKHGCTSPVAALNQPCRLISFMQTYIEKRKHRKSDFVNPIKQPKLVDTHVSIEAILEKEAIDVDNDNPISDLPNPYERPPQRCILCEHDVQLDYKNTRLLSQFVSPHTGQIYGRHITGLCIYMQQRVAKLIKRARYFGFMPYIYKEPKYLKDPKLFDPFKRQ